MMKFLIITILINFLVASLAFGREVIAKKIKVIPRFASIENEIAPFLGHEKDKWRKVDQILAAHAKYENKDRKYKIESNSEEPDAGDVTRYRFFLTKNAGKKEPLAADPLSEVDILADGKLLILEPLVLVNTDSWKRIDLAKATNISPYFSVLRYSAKSNEILVAQFDCAYDCPKTDKTTIWEIEF